MSGSFAAVISREAKGTNVYLLFPFQYASLTVAYWQVVNCRRWSYIRIFYTAFGLTMQEIDYEFLIVSRKIDSYLIYLL